MCVVLFAASFAARIAAFAQHGAAEPGADKSSSAQVSAAGRRIFTSTCASCHGLDGHGGDRAPDILARPELQRMSEAEIARIIQNGIPARRMPAFGGTLEAAQIKQAAAYLHGLVHGRASAAEVPGNAAAGRELFFGRAACNKCHMVNGTGGFLASDLSAYGRMHSDGEIRNAIVDPSKLPDRGERQVTVTTRAGDQISGVVRNEDNFSMQLQSPDGAFHLLMKTDLAEIEFSQQPLMPMDYAQKLSARELDDVVSFLIRTAEANAKSSAADSKRSDEEE
jgi:cytochrome c oxidase cbb3-type subunit III